MTQEPKFHGGLVRLARQSRQMTQKDLARSMDISQAFVSFIEDNSRTPSDEQIEKLDKVLGFPRAFYYQSDPIIGPGVGEIFHRRRKSLTAKELESYYAWTNIKTFTARKLLNAVDWPPVTLPSWSLDIEVGSEEDAATLLRAKWYVPAGPVESVSELLDQAGIMVIPERFESLEMDGMSHWLSDLPPLIFVNQSLLQDRLRFTLMHEVGHLLLHQRSELRAVSDDIETQAHRLAAAFLMPATEIKPQLRNLTLTKLADLKRHWRVAMSAILMRARHLDTITPIAYRDLMKEISWRGWRKREPEQLDVRGEIPGGLFAQLVELHRTELGYSAGSFERLLLLGSDDIEARVLPAQTTPALRLVR